MSRAGSWLPWPPADVLPVPRPARATCQVSRRHQALERRSVRLGAVPHDPGKPRDGWCSGLPTCLAWLLLQGTPPACDRVAAGVKVPVLAHLRGCRGAERLTRAARGRASSGTRLCQPRACGRLTLGCPLSGCFSLGEFGQVRGSTISGVFGKSCFWVTGTHTREVCGGGRRGLAGRPHPQRP